MSGLGCCPFIPRLQRLSAGWLEVHIPNEVELRVQEAYCSEDLKGSQELASWPNCTNFAAWCLFFHPSDNFPSYFVVPWPCPPTRILWLSAFCPHPMHNAIIWIILLFYLYHPSWGCVGQVLGPLWGICFSLPRTSLMNLQIAVLHRTYPGCHFPPIERIKNMSYLINYRPTASQL